MKKIIVLSILFISFLSLSAQDMSGFHVGTLFGMNNTWLIHGNTYGQPKLKADWTFGPAFGFGFGYNYTYQYGFQTELFFSGQGQKYESFTPDSGITKYKREIHLNYMQFPVLFKYTSSDKILKFFVMGGLQLGKRSLADIRINDTTFSAKPRFQSIDIAVLGSVGLDISLIDFFYIELGARVSYGITDINSPAWRTVPAGEKYRSSHHFTDGIFLGINFLLM